LAEQQPQWEWWSSSSQMQNLDLQGQIFDEVDTTGPHYGAQHHIHLKGFWIFFCKKGF